MGYLYSVIQSISASTCTELCCVGQGGSRGGAERTGLGTELCSVGLGGSRGGAERTGLGTELCCFGLGGVGWKYRWG